MVEAMEQADFDAWYTGRLELAQTQAKYASMEFSAEQLMADGEVVYNKFCASCHMVDGKGVPPVFPALDGSAIAIGPVEEHLMMILNGKPGTAMQAFASQLRPDEIAAVTHYERHAWGNNTDDIVQPKDVTNLINTEG